MITWIRKNALLLAWFQALAAMLGSLYFSEVRDFPPCVLCWYQRIAMYPLVIIIGLCLWEPTRRFRQFILPFSIIGGAIAIYHNLLYYNILPEAAAPCLAGVSCTTKFIEYFGFATIPLLSLVGFIAITVLTLLAKPTDNRV